MVRWSRTSSRSRPATAPGSSMGVIWPRPGSSVMPRQSGSTAPSRRACTKGVRRSAVPATMAVGSSSRATEPVSSRAASIRPQWDRTPVGQACTMRAHASIWSALAPGPMVAYRSAHLATGETGPSGARECSISRWARRLPCGVRSGNTRDSAASWALPVLHSSAAAARSRSSGRSAAAMIVIPPMECPPTTTRSPAVSVASSTATRSSARARVVYASAATAGLRPCPRWS